MRLFTFLPLIFLFACGNAPVPEGSVPAFSVPEELKQARLVFQREGNVILSAPLTKGEEVTLTEGSVPRWSADGSWIAFLRGNQVGRVFPESGGVEMLSEVRNPRTLAVPKLGNEVFFSDGDEVKAVNVETKAVRVLTEGITLLELDSVGKRLIGTQKKLGGYQVIALDLDSGDIMSFGRGCSASTSPEGDRITRNGGDHTRLAILDAVSGDTVQSLLAPPGRKTDNQSWSNHPDWVASMDEDSGHIYAHRVSDGAVYRISRGGDGDRPDLWLP